MGLFEKFGLGKRKPRPVGQTLEKGRESPRRARQTNWAFKVGILLVLVLLTLAAFPRSDVYQYGVQVGEQWRKENLVAPFDFAIYKSNEQLEEERREIRERTAPFFRLDTDAQDEMAANRDTVAQQLQRVFDAYASYRLNQLRGRTAEASNDSLEYMARRRDSRLKATPEQWQLLVQSYAERVPELPRSSREPPTGPRLDEGLLQDAWELGTQLLNRGVLDVPLDSVLADEVQIRNEAEQTEQVVSKQSLFGLNEAYTYAENQFEQLYAENPQHANLGTAFFRAIFTPSLNYMRGRTVNEWTKAEDRISLTEGLVSEGEVIVEKGQRVNEDIRSRIASLERTRAEQGDDAILWQILLGQFLLSLATYFIFFLYLYLLRRSIFNENRQIMLLAILFAGIVGLFAIALRVEGVAMYIVPVAIAPILFTVMFDSRVGLFGALTLALIGGQLLNYDFEFAFATIFASTLGVFSVRDIKNRGQFFISAGLVFVGYVVVLGATSIYFGVPKSLFFNDLLLVGVNSFLLIMAYPLLWVFERAFDITTDLSLLELSDTNRPLLKELSLRAPGTFNHSLQVANLAEAAADAVAANALLTRVGALYHDIGKMLKPEYFVENQRPGANPHTQLKPRMSALIIASHVKEGLEMGRQYNLPQRVLDFIPMHHGTTRIEFFYRKAIDQRKEGDPEILESEFRYPGPRPISKETGILMLADSVEAASRSLSDPTHKRLETLIDMIFTARIEDGQLDRTDLTFRELNQIKETFLSMLLGIYHVRVKYPGQDRPEGPSGEAKRVPREVEDHEAASVPEGAMKAIREEGVYGNFEQGVHPGTAETPRSERRIDSAPEAEDDEEEEDVRIQEAGRAVKARRDAAAKGAGPRSEAEIEKRAQQNEGDVRERSAPSGDGDAGAADDRSPGSKARGKQAGNDVAPEGGESAVRGPDAERDERTDDTNPGGDIQHGDGAPPVESDVAGDEEDEEADRES